MDDRAELAINRRDVAMQKNGRTRSGPPLFCRGTDDTPSVPTPWLPGPPVLGPFVRRDAALRDSSQKTPSTALLSPSLPYSRSASPRYTRAIRIETALAGFHGRFSGSLKVVTREIHVKISIPAKRFSSFFNGERSKQSLDIY